MESIFKVYVKFNGLRKRDRKVKFHSDFLTSLDEAPTPDKMNELERLAKRHIEANYKKYAPTFTLEAQHNTVSEGIITRLLFGDPKDVKQLCLM